jgi:hypothetical protein
MPKEREGLTFKELGIRLGLLAFACSLSVASAEHVQGDIVSITIIVQPTFVINSEESEMIFLLLFFLIMHLQRVLLSLWIKGSCQIVPRLVMGREL